MAINIIRDEALTERALLQVIDKKDDIGAISGLNQEIESTGITDFIKKIVNNTSELAKKEISPNIINTDALIQGEIVGADGVISVRADYMRSDFIKIDSNTSYYFHNVVIVAFYDMNKNFLRREYTTNENQKIRITTNLEAFIMIGKTVVTANKIAMVIKSTIPIPFVEFGEKYRKDSAIGYTKKTLEYRNNPIIENMPTSIFRSNIEIGNHLDLAATEFNHIYNLYDSFLVGNWCTKHTMLPDKDGNPIYRYEFKAQKLPTPNPVRVPKIFIITNQHGTEKAGTICQYYLMKSLFETDGSNEFLDYLRYEVDWVIIPVANPSGYNANSRTNSNLVDLNRNYDCPMWEEYKTGEGTNTFKGIAPFSEPETQNIRDVFATNPNIDIAIDFHNFFTNPDKYFAYVGTITNPVVENLASITFGRLTREYKKDANYSWLPLAFSDGSPYYVGVCLDANMPCFARHAREVQDVKYSSTFEVCSKLEASDGIPYSVQSIRSGVEAITNWLISNIRTRANDNL